MRRYPEPAMHWKEIEEVESEKSACVFSVAFSESSALEAVFEKLRFRLPFSAF